METPNGQIKTGWMEVLVLVLGLLVREKLPEEQEQKGEPEGQEGQGQGAPGQQVRQGQQASYEGLLQV